MEKVQGERATNLAKDKRPHKQRIGELYLLALSREPDEQESTALLNYIEQQTNLEDSLQAIQKVYADIIWALIITKEFQFNH